MVDETKDDGGAAFPVLERLDANYGDWGKDDASETPQAYDAVTRGGMSLRDYFAGQVMAQAFANYTQYQHERAQASATWVSVADLKWDHVAALAYTVADAMLAARKAGPHGR